jgi:SAM-dependent methyltransferase
MKPTEIKKTVRERYGRIAETDGIVSCCKSSCSCTSDYDISKNLGYSEEDLVSLPEGADLGLGCGNPVALASIKEGETVIDLGSGAGIDAFLSAKRVGENGRVIGIDMTHEMLEKARNNAQKAGFTNVEFRLGEIEHLPVADNTADLVISNCVINLVPDKLKVFQEILRVLKPGGRIMISDIALKKPLSKEAQENINAWVGCIAGAVLIDDYIRLIRDAGFSDVKIIDENGNVSELWLDDPQNDGLIAESDFSKEEAKDVGSAITSLKISGVKP